MAGAAAVTSQSTSSLMTCAPLGPPLPCHLPRLMAFSFIFRSRCFTCVQPHHPLVHGP